MCHGGRPHGGDTDSGTGQVPLSTSAILGKRHRYTMVGDNAQINLTASLMMFQSLPCHDDGHHFICNNILNLYHYFFLYICQIGPVS